ncbi:MAG: CotH kinase family protein [Verrucomicrobiales bacterium]|nr:CotH kinase family protein [Verrucomicrobiales bacterium]
MKHMLFMLVTLGLWTSASRAAEQPVESHLPRVLLRSEEPVASDRRVPCRVQWVFPPGLGSGRTGELAGTIKFHGASSQAYPKKSFALTLDQPVSWLGMRTHAHWVLNAAFVDRSLMRHKLSYDLFRSLSTSNAPRFAAASRFLEVNYNGNYRGVYLLMERVDRALLGLQRFDSNNLHHACLYKAVDHSATFDHLGHGGFEQREPDPLIKEYWGPLDRFNRFVSTTKDAEFFDPAKGIATRLDLDNTIDFHLLVLLTSNMDGFDKNLLLGRDAPGTNGPLPKFFFVPWDYDATFGRNWEASRVGTDAWLSNHLFERLLTQAEYRVRFSSRWRQLRSRSFSLSTIQNLIDENARIVGDAARRNSARWRTAEGSYPDLLTFEEDVAQMKQWVVERLEWLDREIGQRTEVTPEETR